MRSLAPVVLSSLVALVACAPGADAPGTSSDPPISIRRDIAALERIKYTPRACKAQADCPAGSRCDDDRCTWDCLADSDCEDGLGCTATGTCEPKRVIYKATTSDACASVPPAEQRAALLHLADTTDDDDPPACFDDDQCPCGSYCSTEDAICRVDCLAQNPTPELTCASGLACTPLGACAPSTTTPPPPVQLTIAVAPGTTEGNTATAPVLVPLTVTVAANSFDVLTATSPAVVKLRIAEAVDPAPGAVYPRVRCAPAAPLAATCELTGGWTFDLMSGSLRSAPRTVWVELPQTTTQTDWTLEARSEWAELPGLSIVRAKPVANPPTDPGRYSGTVAWTNPGAPASDPKLSLPVEVIATPTKLVLVEPTRVFLPDGHAVLTREAGKTTMVGWLSTDTTATSPRMEARFDVGPLAYTQATGALTGAIAVKTATGTTNLDLVLTRTDDLGAACSTIAPTCATGSYCDTGVSMCVPGSGPAVGLGIVAATSSQAVPASMLASAQVAAWATPLQALVAANPAQLGGTGAQKLERAYCYRPGLTAAPRFGVVDTLHEPSLDRWCSVAGSTDYAQQAFTFADRTTEVDGDLAGGETFNLLDQCLSDLAVQPTGPATPANLLPTKACASAGRFFLALAANSGTESPVSLQRLVIQLLRQWLGVSAFVATSSVQDRDYDDVLASSGPSAYQRLGTALDQVEQNLRVLLDPTVHPQLAGTGPAAAEVAVAEDYRVPSRPLAHWTFNGGGTSFADTEHGVVFSATNIDTSASSLLANGSSAGACQTSQSFEILDGYTFSIVLGARFATKGTFIPFRKTGTGGWDVWVEATVGGDTAHPTVSLLLRDSNNGTAYFPPVPGQGPGTPDFGLLAFVADAGTYRLIQVLPGGVATTYATTGIDDGGPSWNDWTGSNPGPLSLACNIPTNPTFGVCKSWDRNTLHDGLDVTYSSFVEGASGSSYSCTQTCIPHKPCNTRCTGPLSPGVYCSSAATTRRNQLVGGLFANPPAAAVSALSVAGTYTNWYESPHETIDQGVTQWSVSWDCQNTITNLPAPVTAAKPVCGLAGPQPYAPGGIDYDELSVWPRALSVEDVAAMGVRYHGDPASDSLPPIGPVAGQEQAAGFAVHILEAAAADLDLAAAYVEAERAVMYEECYLGGGSPARDRALTRTGRNLRTVAVLEGEAARLAAMPGAASAPWFARYQANQRAVAGKRSKVLEALRLAGRCQNPLGISEADLPLFNGNNGTAATDKFFGSSRFLTGQAKSVLAAATNELVGARNEYVQQRLSAFQIQLAATDKAQLLDKLHVDYEAALRRYCGAPSGGQSLLDGFLAGTLTSANCFYKTEIPACQNLAGQALSAIPATCLRGEIGQQLVTIQAARVDADNAAASETRAIEHYDADTDYCARRQVFDDATSTIMAAHDDEMAALRQQRIFDTKQEQRLDALAGFLDFPTLFRVAARDIFEKDLGLLGDPMEDLENEQETEAAYQETLLARSHAADLAACYHTADADKFAIDAAHDLTKRVAVESAAAVLAFDNGLTSVEAVANEAASQIQIATNLDRTPPHFHSWLDDQIVAYQRDLAYARRLTYLALRSFEYESQQSIGLRTDVLTARRPDQLSAVIQAIEQRNAPMQGEQGFVIGARPVVLSLREEILHIDELLATPRMPGDPTIPVGSLDTSAQQALRALLRSDSSKIYDNNGVYLGHGLRFSLKPSPWSETSCAERISQVTTALQLEGTWSAAQPNLVLLQENAFGSQECRATPGTVHVAHVQPAHNLLVNDSSAFSSTSSYTSMNVLAQIGKSRTDLESAPNGLSEGFSGRGLYADYILLFPKQTFTDAVLATVKDVLIRLDLVEVTNVAL